MKVGLIFAGIGGWGLGLRRAGGGYDIRWCIEKDPYRRAVLKQQYPTRPVYGDIRRQDVTKLEKVDVIAGGFPCKDISSAGKGAGILGKHSGLWSEFARTIRAVRPRYVFVENVALLARRGLEVVLADLTALGYDAEWTTLRASDFGAPHSRKRIWVVAYLADTNPQGRQSRPRAFRPARWRQSEDRRKVLGRAWASEPELDRVAYGVPYRSHRTSALGDSVVPQVSQWIGEQILLYEAEQDEQ